MRFVKSAALPYVERSGFEGGLNTEERSLVEGVHRFARDTLRPTGEKLDRMPPEAVAAADSPIWGIYRGFAGLGFDPNFFDRMEPLAAARLESLIMEELGWGDVGLAVSIASAGVATNIAHSSGNQALLDLARNK